MQSHHFGMEQSNSGAELSERLHASIFVVQLVIHGIHDDKFGRQELQIMNTMGSTNLVLPIAEAGLS